VASWNDQRIVPGSSVQVDSDHLDPARWRQINMESEPPDEPATLLLSDLNVELELSVAAELSKLPKSDINHYQGL
jgi:hypothetical protein